MDFELQKSRVAAGRVVDERGLGLASVEVSVGSPGEQRTEYQEALAFTAPDGRYVLPLAASGQSNVVADLRGYQRAASASFQPKGNGDVRVPDLALAPLPPVPGIARFADGSPVAGLTLTVWHGSLTRAPLHVGPESRSHRGSHRCGRTVRPRVAAPCVPTKRSRIASCWKGARGPWASRSTGTPSCTR